MNYNNLEQEIKNINPCENCIVRPCCATKIVSSVRVLAHTISCEFLLNFCEDADRDEINSVRETFGLCRLE